MRGQRNLGFLRFEGLMFGELVGRSMMRLVRFVLVVWRISEC